VAPDHLACFTTTINYRNNNNSNSNKNATSRKCCSGRVGEKDDQLQYALRHSTCFFSGSSKDSWSLVRRGSQPHCRNWQKSNALHSRSAGNYVPVPTYFRCSSAFEHSVPCQHVHSFRVPIVTIPDIHFYFC